MSWVKRRVSFLVIISTAFTAVPAAIVNQSVVFVECVTSETMCFCSIELPRNSDHIFRGVYGPRDDSQMFDVTACAIAADMIEDHPVRNCPVFLLPA